ncbi:MAG: hypothetical protein V4671_15900 [Armatimonadota bacterium]
MIHDENLILQTPTTKAATFNSVALDIKGTPLSRPLFAEVLYHSAANAAGANAVTFSVEHSDDNATFTTCASADAIDLNTVAKHGKVVIPFVSQKRYFRLKTSITGGGTTPTVTYQGFVGLSAI